MSGEEQPAHSPAKPLNDAQRHTLRSLVQHVARSFYDVDQIVILDQLAKHDVLKDEDLAGRIGANSKETAKRLAKLVNAGLVRCHTQNEQKVESTTRSSIRKYYYIDYPHFCNLVKWGIADMRKSIDDILRNELANKGYVCPSCRTQYSMLDADRLIDHFRGALFCEVCGTEVVDNVDADDGSRQDRMQRFNACTEWIRALLKKTDEMVLPTVDILDWVKKTALAAHLASQAAQLNNPSALNSAVNNYNLNNLNSDGLAIAGANGTNAPHAQKVSVEIIDEKDSEQRRRALEEEALSKRQQNALPAWHTHSTISGDATALGAANNGLLESTSASLPSLASLTRVDIDIDIEDEDKKDIKPNFSKNDRSGAERDIAQYYANLQAQAQQEAQETTQTDTFTNEIHGRKRPREEEEEEREDEEPFVMSVPDNGGTAAEEEEGGKKGIIVYVNGVAMDVNDVTEDHYDQMTPDEYEAYFTAMGAM